jgi:hypothetical protein
MNRVHAISVKGNARFGGVGGRTGRTESGGDEAHGLPWPQRLRRSAAPGIWQAMRRAGVTMLLLTGLAAPAAAGSDPAPRTGAAVPPTDPLSLIPASNDMWSVSNTDAGCYLLSPRQRNDSGLAIGWRAKHEPGLFLVSFAMAVPTTNVKEPVLVQADGHQFEGSGRMIGFRVFFVPIDDDEMKSVLRELGDTGTLWLKVRHTWIAHGGRGLVGALASYRKACAAGGGTGG